MDWKDIDWKGWLSLTGVSALILKFFSRKKDAVDIKKTEIEVKKTETDIEKTKIDMMAVMNSQWKDLLDSLHGEFDKAKIDLRDLIKINSDQDAEIKRLLKLNSEQTIKINESMVTINNLEIKAKNLENQIQVQKDTYERRIEQLMSKIK